MLRKILTLENYCKLNVTLEGQGQITKFIFNLGHFILVASCILHHLILKILFFFSFAYMHFGPSDLKDSFLRILPIRWFQSCKKLANFVVTCSLLFIGLVNYWLLVVRFENVILEELGYITLLTP